MMLRNILKYTASAAALLTGMLHSDAARLRKERDARPTPRKPERPKTVAKAHPKRAKRRRDVAQLYDRQLRKEREIGTDPLFHNGDRLTRERLSVDWRKQSRKWDQLNG